MPSRNTGILSEIVANLCDLVPLPETALAKLEEHYQDQLLVKAGDVKLIEVQAANLRLAIIAPEAHAVLDYISAQGLVHVTIETTDEVINHLYPNRFIEP